MTELVLYEVNGPIATVTLNRPQSMNTMNTQMLREALVTLEQAAGDEAVRVVVMTGSGRAFCAGGDLSGMAVVSAGSSPSLVEERIDDLRHAMRTSQLLREMPKVTIAAINGACAGAGLAWACAADLRYCAESAKFNTAFMTAGLSGDFGGTWTLPRIVGASKARELYLLAEKFSASDAERIGLVSRCLPDAELMPEVQRVAQRIAGFAPLTMKSIKANLNDSQRLSFSEMLEGEADRHIRCGLTEDAREAASAFLEKREPQFLGR